MVLLTAASHGSIIDVRRSSRPRSELQAIGLASMRGVTRMKKEWLAPVAITMILSTVAVRADDWPQWRGPKRDSISQEKNLLKAWPKEGPKLLWQVKDVGYGYG